MARPNHPRPLELEEALALLHFAAERVDAIRDVTLYGPYFLVVAERKDWKEGEEDSAFLCEFDTKNSESFLHALLLAIDAIVQQKPEAFA